MRDDGSQTWYDQEVDILAICPTVPSTLWVSVFCWVLLLQDHLALLSTPWAIQQVPSVKKFEQLLLQNVCDLENKSNYWQMHNLWIVQYRNVEMEMDQVKVFTACHVYNGTIGNTNCIYNGRQPWKFHWDERFQNSKFMKLNWNFIQFSS